MQQQRIFDPDLEVHLSPQEVTWPLYARIHLDYLTDELLAQLGQVVSAGHTLPYALFTTYRTVNNCTEACVFGTSDSYAKPVWIPWPMLSADISVHAN